MFTMANSKFTEWLQLEISKRGWSQADLARKSKISKSQISLVLSNQRDPGKDFLVGMAHALAINPEVVFSKAGILPTIKESDAQTLEAEWLLSQLPPDKRQQAVDFIRFLAEDRGLYDKVSSSAVEESE